MLEYSARIRTIREMQADHAKVIDRFVSVSDVEMLYLLNTEK